MGEFFYYSPVFMGVFLLDYVMQKMEKERIADFIQKFYAVCFCVIYARLVLL
jgi:hypothetical protein